MPLYEFRCEKCSHTFETLVRAGATPACPSCGEGKLEKLLSVFAAQTGGGESPSMAAPMGCGQCGDPRGPGACRMN